MENEGKRKQIEAALGQFFLRYRHAFLSKVWDRIITHLAEEVIVIECEVEHEESPAEKLTKVMFHDDVGSVLTGLVRGNQGRKGKALAIIVSLEEDET